MLDAADGCREPLQRRRAASPRVDLLHGYDEYVMSYSETRGIIQHADFSAPGTPDTLLHAALLDGRVAAHVEAHAGSPIGDDRAATGHSARRHPFVPRIDRAVEEYGRYLGVPTTIAG